MTERRLGITRRKSLADVADGWTEDCYALYRPASYKDMLEVKSLNPDELDESKGIDFMIGFVKQHVISGKVMVLDAADKLVLAGLEPDDIDQLPPEVVNSLFADITGAKLDPKDTPSVAPTEPSLPPAAVPTETQSSTV